MYILDFIDNGTQQIKIKAKDKKYTLKLSGIDFPSHLFLI